MHDTTNFYDQTNVTSTTSLTPDQEEVIVEVAMYHNTKLFRYNMESVLESE